MQKRGVRLGREGVTFALKMRVSATNVVQQVDAFMSATQKALDAMAQEDTKRQED